MTFLHLADLHLGRTLANFSLLEDQRHILTQILGIAKDKGVGAVVIAGDVYDKSVPTIEAVRLFDWFLTELTALRVPVLAISGNHDSGERLGFAGDILRGQNVYIEGAFAGSARHVTLKDDTGDVHFYLLPFIKPAHVRHYHPDQEINGYTDAVQVALAASGVDKAARNVLVTHQFVVTPGREPLLSDSEIHPVGGTDCVDGRVFEGFAYVALGHLHGAQHTGRETVRYAGSPLKYSLNEKAQEKSVCLVSLPAGGDAKVECIPLQAMRDVREIRGPVASLTGSGVVDAANPEDYVYATLTDENDIVDAIGKLRAVYPNLIGMGYDNARQRAGVETTAPKVEQKSLYQLFFEFYEERNGEAPTEGQMTLVKKELEKVVEET